MSKALDDLDRLRPVDADQLAAATSELLRHERAWQLRELRRRAHLTQKELAAQMSVAQHRVSQIESGGAEHVRLDTLSRYAAALGGKLSVEIEIGDARYVVAGS